MDQIKIGKFIAESRKNLQLTQEQLAEKIGVSNKSISRWENGKTMPDVSLFEPLCDALNITINELLQGEKIAEKEIYIAAGDNILDYGKFLKKKAKIKNVIFGVIILILSCVLLVVMLLAFNKTFLKNAYHSDFYSNVNISIPRFSYYRGTGGMDTHIVKLKTLKQTDEIDVFIERYLSAFEEIKCEEDIYYYHPRYDYTIMQYHANNDGIGFVNTIYIMYHDGYFCEAY